MLDKSYLAQWLIDNKNIYGKTAVNNNTYLSDSQYSKRRNDYQYVKQLVDINRQNNDIELIYVIKASGRMYTRIQGITKDIRKVLLYDYVENDISGASANFFVQVFDRLVYGDGSNLLEKYIKSYVKKYNSEIDINFDTKYNLLNKIKNVEYSLLEHYISGGKADIRKEIANVIKGVDIKFINNKTKYKEDEKYLNLSKQLNFRT